jgi:NSS family neurotransmitter:Na+ symporter
MDYLTILYVSHIISFGEIMGKDKFSRLGFIMAALGMAIGTGNIWRFPRVVSQNGGGAFIIAWLVFLFTWSMPLIIIEFSIGNRFQKGILSSFKEGMGAKYTWMGSFVAIVSTAILFYYAVVTGWCLKYLFGSIFNFKALSKPELYWTGFTTNYQPVLFDAIALSLGAFVIAYGISGGIEKTNKILIPSLFIILLIGVARAITLPEGLKGLNFLFNPDFSKLKDYNVWLQALTQSAWSTGAGWGLILTYAIYTGKKDDSIATSATIGFGNDSASLLAAMLVIPTLFHALRGNEKKLFEVLSSGNQGLTFISVPSLFHKIPMGQIILILFFLALFFAAFTSLLSLLELPTRILIDAGLSRKKSIFFIALASFGFGLPSAISMKIFNNQDFTWSLGLILSGFFFTLFVLKFGVKKFRKEIIEKNSSIKLGVLFDIIVKYLIPLEFTAVLLWWLYKSLKLDKWNNLFGQYSLLSVLSQWSIVIILFIIFNKIIAGKVAK